MTGQIPTYCRRLFTGAIVVLLLLGFGVGGLAACNGSARLWPIANLFFDLGLLVTMVSRGGSLLRW